MNSKYDFPSSFREKKSLTYLSIGTLLYSGGFPGLIKEAEGPISASSFGLKNTAIDILSFSEFTVALCSMLLYIPLLII